MDKIAPEPYSHLEDSTELVALSEPTNKPQVLTTKIVSEPQVLTTESTEAVPEPQVLTTQIVPEPQITSNLSTEPAVSSNLSA